MEEEIECEIFMDGLARAMQEFQSNEDYAIRALESDVAPRIIYSTRRNKESIEEWLEKNKPSTIYKEECSGWIYVSRSRGDKDDDTNDEDDEDEDECSDDEEDENESSDDESEDDLIEAWEKLIAPGRHIYREQVFELAKNYDCTCGKWMLWVSSGGKGDYLWSLIAKGIVNGITLSAQAKISASEQSESEDYNHVICIYNDNFFDKDQLFESERTIRNLGLRCKLQYKPDIYTYIGVYRNNPWLLNPIIYTSNFDVLKNQSIIEETKDFHARV